MNVWLLLATLVGCPAHSPFSMQLAPSAPPADVPPTLPPPSPAGRVDGGVYQDLSLPLSIPVPDGWSAEPGSAGAALRCVFSHAGTGTRVEVWLFPDGTVDPRPRSGCQWTFFREGAFAAPPATPVWVATCTPTQPDGPMILGTYRLWAGSGVHLETVIPEGQLLMGRHAAEVLLSGVRLGDDQP